MSKRNRTILASSLIAAGIWAIPPNTVVAAPDLCAAQAVGVPSRPGAPKWFNWSGTDVVDPNIDDPRWLLATGKNFQFTASGGAKSPVETKALWANEGGQEFLYLSFLININPLSTAPRDLYLGFRLPAAFDPKTLDATYTGGTEYAYAFQFHLDNTASGGPTTLVTPIRCDTDATCGELGTAPTNMWRMFVDHNDAPAIACSDATAGTITGEQFRLLAHDPAHPLTDPPAWMDNAVRYWKLDATPVFPTLKNQWAVQIRVPIVAAGPGANIRQGVVKGSKIWYELTADVGPNRTSIASWPHAPDLTTHMCQKRAFGVVSIVHPDLANDAKWSLLTDFNFGDPAPADCAGIVLDQADIGAVFNAPGSTDFSTATLETEIKAFLPATTTPAPNEIVTRIHNSSGTAITGDFIARFRLANWGSAPFWLTGDTGTFADVPNAKNGVCASGSPPTCGTVTVPASDAGKVAMHFTWQLGAAPADASEYCKFQITPPGASASCVACNCATDAQKQCDATTDVGTKASIPGDPTAFKCVSARFEHECLMVEVDAPHSAVDFVNRSNWNNMEFRPTSVMEQDALIDVRGLPKTKFQLFQDIYLVVMPRNMPDSVAPTTGVDLIRGKVDQLAASLARSYLEDMDRLPANEISAIEDKSGHGALFTNPNCGDGGGDGSGSGCEFCGCEGSDCGSGSGSSCQGSDCGSGSNQGSGCDQLPPNDVELALIRASRIMPPDDFKKAQSFLDIALTPDGPGQAEVDTHKAVDLLGPNTAADVVPTLDIYAFYRVDPLTLKKGALYLPMTSFSVFLFHDFTPVQGMRWAIDGFDKVGVNLYHEILPADKVRVIRVRAQSLEAGESPIAGGDPEFGEGCSASGGTLTGLGSVFLVAGLFAFGRRRRKRTSSN